MPARRIVRGAFRPVSLILTLSCACVALFLVVPLRADAGDPPGGGDLLDAVRAQVEILKWVGSAVVGGLVAAVAALFVQLSKARSEQVALLLRVTEKQAEASRQLAESLDALRDHCKSCWGS